ncbi:MAG: hypothetical protein R3C71_08410 [Candidatus Krumholzibacteriia bacterium]|nr:hypothetical protein [bacterium]MCB9513556.1 hypothetical protein [Candidatus Latescibacterota bacterium]MCB9515596.1 hypothetical protein [Candidatus Latescibacterota bacterium]
MRRALLALGCLALATAVRADHVDPWGLPSGSAALRLATQDSIQTNGLVQGMDFAAGQVDSLSGYLDLVMAGLADLVYVELEAGETEHWLRAPEDPGTLFDRVLIADLGERGIDTVADMLDELGAPVALERFAIAAPGHSYALLQVQAGAAIETTAVKIEVTALADSLVSFDWAWQPNGTRTFIPTASEPTSFGAVKARY